MHKEYRPIQIIKSWVDDLFQLHTGPRSFILEHAQKSAFAFAKLLVAKTLQISDNSTITASTQEVAVQLQKELQSEGISLRVETSATDVGVNFCGGRRRILPLQQLRQQNAATSGRKVSMLCSTTKQARKLIVPGVRPLFYGYASMGAPPTIQKQMRGVICNAGGYRKA